VAEVHAGADFAPGPYRAKGLEHGREHRGRREGAPVREGRVAKLDTEVAEPCSAREAAREGSRSVAEPPHQRGPSVEADHGVVLVDLETARERSAGRPLEGGGVGAERVRRVARERTRCEQIEARDGNAFGARVRLAAGRPVTPSIAGTGVE